MIDLSSRLHRSQGRSGRIIAATTKVTRSEQAELASAASANGQALGEWAREVLLREARSSRTDALFTEIVALRMMLNNFLRPLVCGETMTPDDFTAHMMTIRATKTKVAQEILQQHAAAAAKEQ